MLGGRGGTPDTRYPTTAAPINLIFDDDDDDEGEANQVEEEVVAIATERVRV